MTDAKANRGARPGPARAARQQMLRRIHRWTALPLILFLLLIAVTGTALQMIMAVYGDSGPRLAAGEPLWALHLRDVAVTLHTFAFVGIAGVYWSVVCAIALLVFTVTGTWMFLDLHRGRAATGKRSLFWSTRVGQGALMRSVHRWITPLIAVFTLLLGLTGASLGAYFAWSKMVPLPPPRTSHGGLPPGPGRGPPPQGQLWHDWSLSLHKLNFLGDAGHLLGVLVGFGLIALSLSGAWLYFILYRQRRKMARAALFW